ncbi:MULTISPECIES: GNAT family N-acetyltransferase [Shewanella]|uniref:GNAT family N-acetyltransferase n=1 Tax=Shewanella holmiensis TaxID=2952222 RepID=A0A9X3AN17_9GAMM|nr:MULTISPECIES: GNAT family protein [Shewanella]MCT7941416.1 GNAT family N-acetyltransferase [Shewanella holmiensis]MDP5145353.1 GNAT family protein [Shewanella sp. ULN5]
MTTKTQLSSPVLQSERFVIRAFNEDDLMAFAAYRNDPNVAKYQSWTHYSLEDAKQLLQQTDYCQFAQAGKWYQMAICDKRTDTLLGDIALHFIDEDQIEVGFTVAPLNQKQAVASEALYCVLKYLFDTLGRHRVLAITDCLNIASIALLEKVGFRREGHFIQHVLFKGNWCDEYQYALLASEFNSIREPN